MKKLVIATHNQHKFEEIQYALPEWQCLSLAPFNMTPPVEDGLTFVENALLKARAVAKATGLPALADDSGLVVPSLAGEPGIYSARYAGEHASDLENMQKLLAELARRESGSFCRAAYFVSILVLVQHEKDPTPLIAEGFWHGSIAHTVQGSKGFGYDPIFYLPQLQKTVAELSFDQKQALSHRAHALRMLKSKLSRGLDAR